jgi:large conductance mechanosensitive channel
VSWGVGRLLDAGDRPAEPGQLAGGGDGDDRPALGALLEALPGAVQALLGAPGDRDGLGGLAVVALDQGLEDARRLAVVPCGLDQQPARVPGAGLGDGSVTTMLREFRSFLLRGNLVDLAVAVVVGTAFTAVVNALVKDLITPLIAAVGGKPNFGALTFTINDSRFAYGDFLNALLTFLIVAAVVFLLVLKPVNALMARTRTEHDVESPTRGCPECLSAIPTAAKRCAFCTAAVPPVAA